MSFEKLVSFINNVASLWIFAIMLLIGSDVFLRTFFNTAINGVSELVAISIVAILYLQVPNALKDGSLARSDGLFNIITRRFPALANIMGIFFNLVGASLGVAIVIGGWPRWLQAYHGGYFVGIKGVFTFPEWPHLLIVNLGSSVLAIQFLLFAWDHLKDLFGFWKNSKNTDLGGGQ